MAISKAVIGSQCEAERDAGNIMEESPFTVFSAVFSCQCNATGRQKSAPSKISCNFYAQKMSDSGPPA
jgi:hypothetical protein